MNSSRIAVGFASGVVATIAMFVLMILGVLTGMSPMPKPIPLAIVSQFLGEATPMLLLVLVAVISHLMYGGFWGAVLSAATKHVNIWKGIGLGVVLWLLMGVVVLPFLGWGIFGNAITPKIAVATLMLHLTYGVTLGCLVDRAYHASERAVAAPNVRSVVPHL